MLTLIFAGLLALPAVLVTLVMAPLVALLSVPACFLLLARKQTHGIRTSPANNKNDAAIAAAANEKTIMGTASPPPRSAAAATDVPPQRQRRQQQQRQRQVVITGGSSGIGLAIAVAAAGRADVTRIVILARNEKRLQEAKAQIVSAAAANRATSTTTTNNDSSDGKDIKRGVIIVEAVSVNVMDAEAVLKEAERIMKDSYGGDDHENNTIIKTHLFLCAAGEPHPAYFQDVTPLMYEQLAQANQLGSIYVASAFLKFMQAGTVTFTSSMGGQIGVFGYSAYAPTKFALRGYAECLHMEHATNPDIHIQIAYPPDTDTPGYAKENVGKPTETALISAVAGLATAAQIGSTMLREAVVESTPRFHVYFNFDGFLLCTLTAGFSPVSTLADAVAQVSILCVTRWISLFYLADWHRILHKHYCKQEHGGAENRTKRQPANDVTIAADDDDDKSGKKSPSGRGKID